MPFAAPVALTKYHWPEMVSGIVIGVLEAVVCAATCEITGAGGSGLATVTLTKTGSDTPPAPDAVNEKVFRPVVPLVGVKVTDGAAWVPEDTTVPSVTEDAAIDCQGFVMVRAMTIAVL